MKVYLDHAATTPLAKEVLEAMLPYFSEKFGNANSLHFFGMEAFEAVEEARKVIAKAIGAKPEEVIFTSGGTEANNFAIKGIALANKEKGKHIITQKTEHKCVLNSCKFLEKIGFEVTYLDVDEKGFVNISDLEEAIREDTILVSIMHANNEIGTVHFIREIAKICKRHKIYFHTDACQSFTKEKIELGKGINLITINAHKIYGPKGVGALIIEKGTKIEALLHGGEQEFGFRSGTLNVPGIVGFAKAVEIASEEKNRRMRELRDHIIERIMDEVKEVYINGPYPERRLINNANFSFKGIEGESLVLRLSARGVAVSTGSACSSKSLEPSHVLLAIGRSPKLAHGSLRITVGWENTTEEVDYAVDVIKEEVRKLRKVSAYW